MFGLKKKGYLLYNTFHIIIEPCTIFVMEIGGWHENQAFGFGMFQM